MSSFASLHGQNFSETLDTRGAGAQDDFIIAKAGSDTVYAGGGDDQVFGGSGRDLVYAGPGDDTVFGQGQQDTLYGQAGDDSLDGGFADDSLLGGHGDDTLVGGRNDDTLIGGAGDDVLSGDGMSLGNGNAFGTGAMQATSKGEDVFYFEGGFGNDRILDFEFGPDGDMIEIRKGTGGVNDLTQLQSQMAQVGNDVVITLGSDTITIENVKLSDLTPHLAKNFDIV